MEKTLFASLRLVLSRRRGAFFRGFLMLLFSNLLLIGNPLLMRQAVMAFDPSSIGGATELTFTLQHFMGPYYTQLLPWVAALLTMTLTSAILKYFMRVTFISISRRVEKEVRSVIFERIQKQSMAFYDKHGIGELLSRLTNDITAYRDVLGPGIMYPLFFVTIVFPGLLALFTINTQLATLALVPLFLIPLINGTVRGSIYSVARAAQGTLADLSNRVQEHYSSIRIIKSYVAESATLQLFSTLSMKLMQQNIKLNILQGLMFPLFTFMTKLVTVGLVLYTGLIIFKAWGMLTTADFISFMWIQSYIFFPVLMLAWLLPIYERGRAAYDRLVEIYQEPIEVLDQSTGDLKISPSPNIAFHNLSFTYPTAKRPTLHDLTLNIAGGEFVGITGPVGAGKTTVFKLLNREYEISNGMISLDGIDIHDYPLKAFHQEMVTVDQVPFLFSKTIAENVSFGKSEASQDEIQDVARYADLHETVMEFPRQYNTVIGERGVTLSGGQKQRIAMARAFLVDRSILLLDDIFSAVDASTEKRIFDAMRRNFAGKTVILITHRVSILEQMDRVVYLDEGKVQEVGTPVELLEKNGRYAALVQLQQMTV